jgi:hypothetical protein
VKRSALLAVSALLPNLAIAQGVVPDPAKVATIFEAAQTCGFDQIGIQWTEKAPNIIQIWIPPAEVQSFADPQNASPKFSRLRECFFPWAYERKITVEMNVGEKTP